MNKFYFVDQLLRSTHVESYLAVAGYAFCKCYIGRTNGHPVFTPNESGLLFVAKSYSSHHSYDCEDVSCWLLVISNIFGFSSKNRVSIRDAVRQFNF